MKKRDTKSSVEPDKSQGEPSRIRVPGFVNDEDIGLGDVIKRAAYAFGIRPCGGCERRAASLNRWIAFSGRRTK